MTRTCVYNLTCRMIYNFPGLQRAIEYIGTDFIQ